ncbi:putative oxygenase MesX [Rathayibacter festucae]|uniref:putative oxygenase MesX n=1 Tax=Rathayibacter festucae TaxID=110937 RepID=UPI002A69DA8A|nr:putative oxygenase MesX [Rathayibacter festucae]MDY0912265.1 putative oxygenase MesX [Rathayibacter festucae]
MANDVTFRITTTCFDEHYTPSSSSRATTNFANLARGEHRRENLRNALTMIDRRFNDLAHWDNPGRDRYAVELEIVSVEVRFPAEEAVRDFPLLEVLDVRIADRLTGVRHHGIVGNNFSSYVRDFDFSVRLPAANKGATEFTVPDDFGDLHGALFQSFLDSDAYRERFSAPPVICISVSTSRTYHRTSNHHPILGVEYRQDERSLTDEYFGRMGLQVRYFLAPGSVAPLAYYFRGDLLNDHSNLQLAGTISTMETFQKIYRPEIYNTNSAAADVFRPSLQQQDYSRTQIDYDRAERDRLAVEQGAYTAEHFIEPHRELLDAWAAKHRTPAR